MATLFWFVLFVAFLGMLSLAAHDMADDESARDVFRLWKWLTIGMLPLFLGFAYVLDTYGCFAK